MAYCTRADIQYRLTAEDVQELADDTGNDPSTTITARIDDAIAWADSIIDGYCGQRYAVAFTTVPDRIKYISVDIAIYRLFSRRASLELPENVVEDYKSAIALLKDIAKGLFTLSDPEPASNSDKVSTTTVSTTTRTFDRDELNDLI